MESNQDGLKALLQEKDCVGVPANEEYQLIIYLMKIFLKMNWQTIVCFL